MLYSVGPEGNKVARPTTVTSSILSPRCQLNIIFNAITPVSGNVSLRVFNRFAIIASEVCFLPMCACREQMKWAHDMVLTSMREIFACFEGGSSEVKRERRALIAQTDNNIEVEIIGRTVRRYMCQLFCGQVEWPLVRSGRILNVLLLTILNRCRKEKDAQPAGCWTCRSCTQLTHANTLPLKR